MRFIESIFYSMLILSIFISCDKNGDSTYFKGEIRNFEVGKKSKNVTLEVVSLNGANFGWLSVYDSLMIFRNPKLADSFFNVFNVDTGEEIGTFVKKGGGPDELADCHKIFNFFEEGGDLKTLLLGAYEEKLLIWNITQSIKQGATIIDNIFPYTAEKENKGAFYSYLFYQGNNAILAKVQSVSLKGGNAILPFYQHRTIDTNELSKNLTIYKKLVKNDTPSNTIQSFSASNDARKPDGTKVVQAMLYLPQLNILNVKTEQVFGSRMKDGLDFSVFEDGADVEKIYYIGVQTDDNYIYALYWGKEIWELRETPYVNTIHVFDWDGNFVQKIETDRGLKDMWIDTVRNRLYLTCPMVDDVFYLELNGLLS